MDLTPLVDAQAGGAARPFDVELAALLARLAPDAEGVALAAYLVSRQAHRGDVCIALAEHAGRVVVEGLIAPRLADWTRALAASPLVGGPGDHSPLILDRGRLYLGRYWHYEARLAADLARRGAREDAHAPEDLLAILDRLFPPGDGPDWQRVAAALAVRRGFSVISGGPGTGKTTTVAKLLALLVALSPRRLRIGLAAPTGKAAARLTESIRAIGPKLACDEETRAALPDTAKTLHRLLGYRADGLGFRHHRDNPLHLDVLVVDEASMVDLALMAALVDALPEHTRLILLGDKDQLASVESGSVLGDICRQARPGTYSRAQAAYLRAIHPGPLDLVEADLPPIADAIAMLRHSYRFGATSAIGRLAAAVDGGEPAAVIALLEAPGDDSVQWLARREALAPYLASVALPLLAAAGASGDPREGLAALARYRILTAVREGPLGVVAINRAVERLLAARGGPRPGELWYPGRPVMITQNDYAIGLYNGDTGLALPDPDAGGRLRVFFPGPGGEPRRILPQRLPPHETAYAMTIHKAQGSELDRVALVLPEGDAAILTRELLYTGLTRARGRVDLLGSAAAIGRAVRTRTRRVSGLAEALWGGPKGRRGTRA